MKSVKSLSIFFLLLLAIACHNEPYDLKPLGIYQVKTGTATASYFYRNQRITMFTRRATGILDTMRFYYSGNVLSRIVIDSTAESYGLMNITGTLGYPDVDSLFLVTPTTKTLLQARRFSFERDQHLTGIEVRSWDSTGETQSNYTIEWTGENITTLSKTLIKPSGETLETALGISYDGQKGVYSNDVAYLYTISLDQIYWLSSNNPIEFARDGEQLVYTYIYNKYGYPSQIVTDKGVKISNAYTELR